MTTNEELKSNINWRDQSVLITGGTGSFGVKCVNLMLRKYRPKKLVIFSRDELKQHEMRQSIPDSAESSVRYFIGDIRDRERLLRAFYGIDIVIHAAALKQVPACEFNPFEATQTNIIGAKNVIDAAIDTGVGKVITVSTDKAVNPSNLYGATKLVAEKLFVQGNAYVGDRKTRFACTRYGNVIGSRGSVVNLFKEQRATGSITMTDPNMTRFWITLEQGVEFVIRCLNIMGSGEIFVPKLPSMKLADLANCLAKDSKWEIIGIRPGERLHEILISSEESTRCAEYKDMYIIRPHQTTYKELSPSPGIPVPSGFSYTSDNNDDWLSQEQFDSLVGDHS